MTCTGQVKALATTNGGARTVETYSMQSPENWMEDFGSGTIANGRATVSIDAAFAETVSGAAGYHVFLTPRGDSKGLYMTNATPASFEVRESGGWTSTIGFDYRIVAKRRGFETQRMVDVTESIKAVKARNELKAERFQGGLFRSKATRTTQWVCCADRCERRGQAIDPSARRLRSLLFPSSRILAIPVLAEKPGGNQETSGAPGTTRTLRLTWEQLQPI